MKTFLKIITLALIMISCGRKEQKQEATIVTAAPVAETVMLPQLTDQQKGEGWKLLFDGQTKDGWQIFKARKNNTWEVKNGTLHAIALDETTKGVGDERSDIMTTNEYGNFELTFDWKISKEGNSGVIFRATEEFEQPYLSGPEYQIIDDKGYPGKLKDTQLTGASYDMQVTKNASVNAVGEWNSSKIVAHGNHIEHWLNGAKVLEYELGSADWKKRKAGSKWKDAKGYGLAKKGHIDFQDHGSEVWFKNIMIHEL